VTTLEDMYESPWADSSAYRPVSVNGCAITNVAAADVKRVVTCDTGSAFDRSEIAIVELNDGRFVGWESWSDVTGSGFHHDAYGGDVEVWFASTLEELKPNFSEKAWGDLFR